MANSLGPQFLSPRLSELWNEILLQAAWHAWSWWLLMNDPVAQDKEVLHN